MKSSYKVALGLAVVSALWLGSGLLGIGKADDAPQAGAAEERELFAVRVADMTAQPMVREVIINGRTLANRTVDLRSEIRGRVEEVLAQRGASLKAGDPVVRIAVEARRAELEEARANLNLRRIEFEAAQKLAERGFNSEVRRAEAKAQFEAAQARLRQAELLMEKTTVSAPFDGILDARPTEIGDFLDVNDLVATIVDLDPIRFVAFVTERNVTELRVGAPAKARVFGGNEIEGTITFIAAQAEQEARTFRVEVEAPNPGYGIVAGLTASLNLPVAEKLAHKISPAVLTLDDKGAIGVKTLTPDDIVTFTPVQIMGSAPDGVWIGGLPDRVRLVVVGQEFIVAGQKVKPVPVDGGLS